MEKKKRKRIAMRAVRDDQRIDAWDHYDTREDDFYPVTEAGQVAKILIQGATRMVYETFGKESECSHNNRRHYRRDGKIKVPFDSLYKARSACARLWDKNEDMRPYKCSTCGMFHIGHKEAEGHSIPYMFYIWGDILGGLIDVFYSIKELFSDEYRYTPYS